MPINNSHYKPPHLFRNGHFSTIYAGVFRKVNGITQERESLILDDGDYLDLDWSFTHKKTRKVIIIMHGLEGNAQRPYMTGTAKIFNENGFDAVCVNLRSCSGKVNNLYRSYHSGATDDLQVIINHILSLNKYDEIVLKGFSLGGNITLKYLGEGNTIPKEIKAAIAVSVPCFLFGSMLELHKIKNVLYAKRFKKHLLEKLKWKQQLFPEKVNEADLKRIITLKDFDDFYTSRAHGFADALDYYEKSSSLQFLPSVKIPTLIINAKNDSFLSPECYPVQEARDNSSLYLEMPDYGGHVGFFEKDNVYYNEKRAIKFIEERL